MSRYLMLLAIPAMAFGASAASATDARAHLAAEAVYQQTSYVEVRRSLTERCFRAGMAVLESRRGSIVCSTRLVGYEPFLATMRDADASFGELVDSSVHLRQVVHFILEPVGLDVHLRAESRVDGMNAEGALRSAPLTSTDYHSRLQDMLDDLDVRPVYADAPPQQLTGWEHYFDSEREWRLEAHRRAVATCDAILSETDPVRLEQRLLDVGVRAADENARGGCQRRQEAVYLWGLAVGRPDPSPAAYYDYLRGGLGAGVCPPHALADACR